MEGAGVLSSSLCAAAALTSSAHSTAEPGTVRYMDMDMNTYVRRYVRYMDNYVRRYVRYMDMDMDTYACRCVSVYA